MVRPTNVHPSREETLQVLRLPLRPCGLERNRTSPCMPSEPTGVTWIRIRRCRETKGRSLRPLVLGIRRCVGWTRRRWSLDETSERDAHDTVSSGTDLAEKREVSRVACIDSFLPRARHAHVPLLSSLPPRTCVVVDLSFVTDSSHDALHHHLRWKPGSIQKFVLRLNRTLPPLKGDLDRSFLSSKRIRPNLKQKRKKKTKMGFSHAGNRTRVAWVKARYPNRLDYMGVTKTHRKETHGI